MASPRKHTAFGVHPGCRATYELRLSRCQAMAATIAHESQAQAQRGNPRIELLDVGVHDGTLLRYLEPYRNRLDVGLHGVDLFPRGKSFVYRSEEWQLDSMDLEQGMPRLPADAFDVVVCEQVLEHLHQVQPAIADLHRVLRPGGLMIVGVPIFPWGLHRLRPLAIQWIDFLSGPRQRGHIQSWSAHTFRQEFDRFDDLDVECVRGFRIVSGGILRRLEFYRWWWRCNAWLGARLPSLCVEVQLLIRKRSAGAARSPRGGPSRAA